MLRLSDLLTRFVQTPLLLRGQLPIRRSRRLLRGSGLTRFRRLGPKRLPFRGSQRRSLTGSVGGMLMGMLMNSLWT